MFITSVVMKGRYPTGATVEPSAQRSKILVYRTRTLCYHSYYIVSLVQSIKTRPVYATGTAHANQAKVFLVAKMDLKYLKQQTVDFGCLGPRAMGFWCCPCRYDGEMGLLIMTDRREKRL